MYSALVYKEKRRPIGRSYWKSYRLVIDKSGSVILTSANGERTKACASFIQASDSIRLCKSKNVIVFKGGKRASFSTNGYVLVITMHGMRRSSSFEETKLVFDTQGDLFGWLHFLVALLQAKNGQTSTSLSASRMDLNAIAECLDDGGTATDDDWTSSTGSNPYLDDASLRRLTKDYDPFWPMHLVAWPSIWKHFQSYGTKMGGHRHFSDISSPPPTPPRRPTAVRPTRTRSVPIV